MTYVTLTPNGDSAIVSLVKNAATPREPAINGDEQDIFSRKARGRYCYTQRPGVCKAAKRAANRRARRRPIDKD